MKTKRGLTGGFRKTAGIYTGVFLLLFLVHSKGALAEGFGIAGNTVTVTTDVSVFMPAIQSNGVVGSLDELEGDALKTMSFDLVNENVGDGAYVFNLGVVVDDAQNDRRIEAYLPGVNVDVSAGGTSVTVPANSDLRISGRTSGGTVISTDIPNGNANGPITASGTTLTVSLESLQQKVQDKFGSLTGDGSALNEFVSNGRYTYTILVQSSSVPVGFTGAGGVVTPFPSYDIGSACERYGTNLGILPASPIAASGYLQGVSYAIRGAVGVGAGNPAPGSPGASPAYNGDCTVTPPDPGDFVDRNPADIADDVLDDAPGEAAALFEAAMDEPGGTQQVADVLKNLMKLEEPGNEDAGKEKAAQIIGEMEGQAASEVVAGMSRADAAELLDAVVVEKAAIIVERLPAGEGSEILEKMPPLGAAEIIVEMGADAGDVVTAMVAAQAAVVFEEMPAEGAVDVVLALTTETAVDILEKTAEASAAGILEAVPASNAANILNEMNSNRAADIVEVMTSTGAAGVFEEMTPAEAEDILDKMDAAKGTAVIVEMNVDKSADIMEELAPKKGAEYMAAMDASRASAILCNTGALQASEIVEEIVKAGNSAEANRELIGTLLVTAMITNVDPEQDGVTSALAFMGQKAFTDAILNSGVKAISLYDFIPEGEEFNGKLLEEVNAQIGDILDAAYARRAALKEIVLQARVGEEVAVVTDPVTGIIDLRVDKASFPVVMTDFFVTGDAPDTLVSFADNGLGRILAKSEGEGGMHFSLVPALLDTPGLLALLGEDASVDRQKGLLTIVDPANGDILLGNFGWGAGNFSEDPKTIVTFEIVGGDPSAWEYRARLVYSDGSRQDLGPAIAEIEKLAAFLEADREAGGIDSFLFDRNLGVLTLTRGGAPVHFKASYLLSAGGGQGVPLDRFGLNLQLVDMNADQLPDVLVTSEAGVQILYGIP